MSKKNRDESRSERAAAALAEQRRKEQRRRSLMIGGVVAVLLLIVIAAVYGIQSQRDTSGQVAKDVPAGLTDGYGVTDGPASAPKTVTIYEDFQCPICHEFEQATQVQLRAAVADGKIQLDYRMVAFLDRASSTKYSTRALNAAAVVLDAAGKDVFLKFHDALYENQPAEGSAGLSDSELVKLAVQAGATEADVRPGIESNKFHQWVVNATDQMSKNNVNGTPTVLVDGKVQGDGSLQSSIDAALAAAK